MGAKSTKDNASKSEIVEAKNNQISLLFNCNVTDKAEISEDKLKTIWRKYLSQELLEAVNKIIFKNKRLYVPYEDLLNFYWTSCEDTTEKEAEVILDLAKIFGGGCIQQECLSKVVSEFVLSYFKICLFKSNSSFNQWSKISTCSNEVDTLTSFLLSSINHEMIELYTIDSWMAKNALFRIIYHDVFKTIFNTLPLEHEKVLFPSLVLKPGCISILNPSDVIFLNWHISEKSIHKWRLLFSTDSDGQSWSTLLKAIIGQGPTIIIIHDTKGFVFGAFASHSWNPNPNFYGDEDTFLFTLYPEMNIFEPTGYNKNFQYINTGQSTLPNGLGIGGVHNYWGLFLKNDFGTGLVSETCTTFKHFKKLASDKEFTVDKLQVWGVGKPDPTPEELGERITSSTSVLDRDPAAAAILELAGRSLHSTEIRKMKHIDDEEPTNI